jgi:hypothetical protein
MDATAQAPHGRRDPIVLEVAVVGGPHGGGYYAPDGVAGIHGGFSWRLWMADGQAVGLTVTAESFLGPFGDSCYLTHPGPGATCLPHFRGLQTLMLQWASDLFGNRGLGVTAGAGLFASHHTKTGAAALRAELIPQRGAASFAIFAQHLYVPAFRGTSLDLTLVGVGILVR